jgi:aminopeptidase
MRSFDENLRLYAELTVKEGLNVSPGQEVLVFAETDQTEFVRLIAEEAYKSGVKNVEVSWRDPGLVRARFLHASHEAINYAPGWFHDGIARAHTEGAARLYIASEDPMLLADIAPARVAASNKARSKAGKKTSDLVASMAINWCVVGAAGDAWARRVFPGDANATAKLWDAIFLTSRVLEPDPVGAWNAHSETLESKVKWLDSLQLKELHFVGPGTDLRVGLVEDHLWAGGGAVTKTGIRCSANIPTEEVFTMPHRERVNGFVCSTKPLSLRGQLLDGIRVVFKDGAVVEASAEKGNEALQELLSTDEGARRLGEVALVPNSCKVAQTGTLFLNTLYDENAASHIALGASYAENLKGYDGMNEEQRLAHGANDSLIHVDWMIGSAEIDVDGVISDGSVVPLMRKGEWA